jgi:hypothetical protein
MSRQISLGIALASSIVALTGSQASAGGWRDCDCDRYDYRVAAPVYRYYAPRVVYYAPRVRVYRYYAAPRVYRYYAAPRVYRYYEARPVIPYYPVYGYQNPNDEQYYSYVGWERW